MRAENDLFELVITNQGPRSPCILVTVSRLSQILAVRFLAPSTERENAGRTVLYSSDPALAGLKERL